MNHLSINTDGLLIVRQQSHSNTLPMGHQYTDEKSDIWLIGHQAISLDLSVMYCTKPCRSPMIVLSMRFKAFHSMWHKRQLKWCHLY